MVTNGASPKQKKTTSLQNETEKIGSLECCSTTVCSFTCTEAWKHISNLKPSGYVSTMFAAFFDSRFLREGKEELEPKSDSEMFSELQVWAPAQGSKVGTPLKF